MKSVFRMHVLAAGHGDSLWIDFGNPQAPTRILVDAGTQGTSGELTRALNLVRGESPSHELFIVTHVDQDHIGGSLAIMEDAGISAQLKEVWFNGWKHLLQASGQQPFGPVQGERLTAALEIMPGKWNAAFAGGPVLRNSSSRATPVQRQVGEATVTILSPTANELVALLGPWEAEVKGAGMVPGMPPPKQRPSKSGMQALGARNIERLANTVVGADTAVANGSSISALLEFEGRRLLLGADAHPAVLLAGIRQIQPTGRLAVDVFKAPHHGSAANVTDALLDAIAPKTVVFSSNGAYFGHPDEVAVARVVRKYKDQGVELVFNYPTRFNRMWMSPTLQAQWNFTARYGKGDCGITVHLK
ncbi:hypothetical protein PQR64_28905 [Paraburkholderia phytofirmans]|uniref:ComEC/Rec2 family competence protein n=1 Tax=Paraburkholderia phytofirmans TaxID=261302 RepID=UPI0038BB0CB3